MKPIRFHQTNEVTIVSHSHYQNRGARPDRTAVSMPPKRAGCKAVLTAKRCLENYLHPEAIRNAGQIDVKFDDFDCVAELTARELAEQRLLDLVWQLQARRSHHRMANRAKRWLNTIAADHMTADLLNERDPQGEIRSWLDSLSTLIDP